LRVPKKAKPTPQAPTPELVSKAQQQRRDNQFDEIKAINRIVNIDELGEDLFCRIDRLGDENQKLKDKKRKPVDDDPIEVSLWPRRVVNELNINGIPSRQHLFDRSLKRLPLLSTIHVW
jgi:hypothetical protein